MSSDKRENVMEEKFVKKAQKKEAEKKVGVEENPVGHPKDGGEKPKTIVKKEDAKKDAKKEKPKRKEKPIEEIKFHEDKKIDITKKRKPTFTREELHKQKRLKDKWRKPRGKDSKVRKEKRGKSKTPKIGYKNPESIRGLVKGYRAKMVHNVKELSVVNQKEEAAIISRHVGRKKRNEIIKEANKLRITILNPRKGELKK